MKLLQKAGCEMAEMFFGVGNAYGARVAQTSRSEQNFKIQSFKNHKSHKNVLNRECN